MRGVTLHFPPRDCATAPVKNVSNALIGAMSAMKGRSPLQDYSQCGHVVSAGDRVEIVFTSVKSKRGYSLDHFYCTVQAESALSCFNIDGIGKEGDLFRIERIGHAPASPDGQMDDGCPARERPQV